MGPADCSSFLCGVVRKLCLYLSWILNQSSKPLPSTPGFPTRTRLDTAIRALSTFTVAKKSRVRTTNPANTSRRFLIQYAQVTGLKGGETSSKMVLLLEKFKFILSYFG